MFEVEGSFTQDNLHIFLIFEPEVKELWSRALPVILPTTLQCWRKKSTKALVFWALELVTLPIRVKRFSAIKAEVSNFWDTHRRFVLLVIWIFVPFALILTREAVSHDYRQLVERQKEKIRGGATGVLEIFSRKQRGTRDVSFGTRGEVTLADSYKASAREDYQGSTVREWG